MNSERKNFNELLTQKGFSSEITNEVSENVNIVMANIPGAFSNLPIDGTMEFVSGTPDFGTTAHIQGMGICGKYILLTHNRAKSNGYWIVINNDYSSNSVEKYDISFPEGYFHPGGIQVIGNYVAVGMEKNENDNSTSYVCFYDLTNLSDSTGPVLLTAPQIYRSKGGAAAVGITGVSDYYILAVYTSFDSLVHIYQSNNFPLGNSNLIFYPELFSFQVMVNDVGVGYDNINLYTDQAGNVYMIGMRGEDMKTMEDYIELIYIDVANKTYQLIQKSRQVSTDTGGLGKVGSHFRYGAGTQILDSNNFWIYCSSRISVWPLTQINTFLPECNWTLSKYNVFSTVGYFVNPLKVSENLIAMSLVIQSGQGASSASMGVVVYDNEQLGVALLNRVQTQIYGDGGTWDMHNDDQYIACGDIDGDSKNELIIWNPNTWIGLFRYELNNIACSWMQAGNISGAGGTFDLHKNDNYVACGDIDGDGKTEFIIWNPNTWIGLFRYDGTSGLTCSWMSQNISYP